MLREELTTFEEAFEAALGEAIKQEAGEEQRQAVGPSKGLEPLLPLKKTAEESLCAKGPSEGGRRLGVAISASSQLPAQVAGPLDSSLRFHLKKLHASAAPSSQKAEGQRQWSSTPAGGLRCQVSRYVDMQKDVGLHTCDFSVEVFAGSFFVGPAFVQEFGSAQATTCPACHESSRRRLLRNSTEQERCLFKKDACQGILSDLCSSCLSDLVRRQEQALAALRDLPGFLSDDEKQHGVVLWPPSFDFNGQMLAYRLFHWMKSKNVKVRIQSVREPAPHFVLPSLQEFEKLRLALGELRAGQLVSPPPSVCLPHFKHEVDEVMCTQNGKRTFMDKSEAQPFSCVHGSRTKLLACLRDRKEQFISDVSEEALVGRNSGEGPCFTL